MGAGDAVFVGGVLHELGLPGAIIIVLMLVVSSLAGVIVYLQKHANKVYGYRLAERDTLNKALTDSTSALHAMLKAVEDRNEVTEDLVDIIAKQSTDFAQVNERIKVHYEAMKEDNTRMALVVSAISESIRNLAQISQEIKITIPNVASEVKMLVQQNANNSIPGQTRRRK